LRDGTSIVFGRLLGSRHWADVLQLHGRPDGLEFDCVGQCVFEYHWQWHVRVDLGIFLLDECLRDELHQRPNVFGCGHVWLVWTHTGREWDRRFGVVILVPAEFAGYECDRFRAVSVPAFAGSERVGEQRLMGRFAVANHERWRACCQLVERLSVSGRLLWVDISGVPAMPGGHI